MKKILLSFFCIWTLMISCNRTYIYVEKFINTAGEIQNKEPDKIKAPSDSIAYLEAYNKFAISTKVYNDMKEAGMADFLNIPVSFKLYTSKGKDITNITFTTKNSKSLEIDNFILSTKNHIKEHVDEMNEKTVQQQTLKRDSAKILVLMPFFNKKTDEFDTNEMTWYVPKNAPKYISSNGIYVYFGINKKGLTPLRLKVQYYSDEWLFFRKVNFSIDGKAYEFIPTNTETDNSGGYIWEWFDEAITSNSDKQLLLALCYANNAKMKFVGRQYYDIKNITPQQIKDIQRTIELYRAMGGETMTIKLN